MSCWLLLVGVLLLVLWVALHPYLTPDICYGFSLGVPYPYHPIPCGMFPFGG